HEHIDGSLHAALVTLLAWQLIDAARARRTRFTLPLSRRARVWPSASIHSTRKPVSRATDRGNVLCGTSYLLALICHCRGVDHWWLTSRMATLGPAGATWSEPSSLHGSDRKSSTAAYRRSIRRIPCCFEATATASRAGAATSRSSGTGPRSVTCPTGG